MVYIYFPITQKYFIIYLIPRASEAKVSHQTGECAKVQLLLDEEKKKVEDLQFRLEEEQIVG